MKLENYTGSKESPIVWDDSYFYLKLGKWVQNRIKNRFLRIFGKGWYFCWKPTVKDFMIPYIFCGNPLFGKILVNRF